MTGALLCSLGVVCVELEEEEGEEEGTLLEASLSTVFMASTDGGPLQSLGFGKEFSFSTDTCCLLSR